MHSKITHDIDMVVTFKMLAHAYEEIAVVKMQRVRSSVLATRDFMSSLSSVFINVKSNYRKEIKQLMEKQKQTGVVSFSTLSTNGKTVSVFVSANGKMYGGIIKQVFQFFTDALDQQETDVVIIGKAGKGLFDESSMAKHYTYFDLPDSGITVEMLKPIITHIGTYERVHVYYGKFVNVIKQEPAVSNVSGQEALLVQEQDEKDVRQFAFEPALKEILHFFETQVFTLLFKQTTHEAELARLASRINAMEEAIGNIDEKHTQLLRQQQRAKKYVDNKKQLETLAGIALWRVRS